MTVALIGAPLSLALAVQAIAPVRCIVVDAPDEQDALRAFRTTDSQLAVVRSNGALPVMERSLHGVFVGSGNPGGHVFALRTNGRLVAPVDMPVPAGVNELARDDQHWVAERVAQTTAAPASLVQLRRRR
jgi:hypothetical protein